MMKVRYKKGDIILIPLQENKSAPARILNKKGEAILLEMYAVEPVKSADDLPEVKTMAANCKTFMVWVFDEQVRHGEWEIIGNIKVELPVEMQLFWDDPCFSDKPDLRYLQKGRFDTPFYGEGEKIIIDKSEIKNYAGIGVDFPNLARLNFKRFLLREGLIDKIIDDDTPDIEPIKNSEFEPFTIYNDEKTNNWYALLEADGIYKQDIFAKYDMEGNGDDWTELAEIYINENMPQNISLIDFDPEGGMFVAFSENEDIIKTFVKGFREVCDDADKFDDLFSQIE